MAAASYSPRFQSAFADLLGIEGGYVNDPDDHGGATKYGISLRFLSSEGAFDLDQDGRKDFDLDFDGDIDGDDIRALTPDHAQALYWRCFWLRVMADSWPPPIGEMLFDQAVNGGVLAAKKLLQEAINLCLYHAVKSAPATLVVDGQLGDKSRTAFDWLLSRSDDAMDELICAFREAVRNRYRAIVQRYPAQQRFLRGWLARAEKLGARRA